MTIRNFRKRTVVTIQRQSTVVDAARLMRENHIGDVVVVDARDSRIPVGVVTDRDIVIKVVGEGLAPALTPVGSIMSSPVVTLREDDGILAALDKMSTGAVRNRPRRIRPKNEGVSTNV